MKAQVIFIFFLFFLKQNPASSQTFQAADSISSMCSFTLYPNPTRENLSVVFDEACTAKTKLFEIIDPLTVVRGSWQFGEISYTINLKDIKPDFYYVQITIDNRILRRKFLREQSW